MILVPATPPANAQALAASRTPLVNGVLIGSIAALLLAMLAWAAWAQVDEVVAAQGRVAPAGRSKLINHPVGGRVTEVYVQDGQRVAEGQPLLVLDGEVLRSELAEGRGRWQVKAVAAERLAAEADGRPLVVPDGLATARPDLVLAERRLMAARAEALDARRATAAKQVQARKGDLQNAAAEAIRARHAQSLLRQQQTAVRELNERGLYPTLKRVALEKELSDTDGEAAKAGAALEAARAALAESQSRLESVDRDWHSDVLAELAQTVAERDRLGEANRAQAALVGGMELRAPVAGVVEELALTAPGQAIAAHETIMKIIPSGGRLVVEAQVKNDDVGRLRTGMPAVIKVHAFDWLRFGSLKGRLEKVAADAVVDPASHALTYAATVVVERDHLGAGPGQQEILPGMIVDVELMVGERTILSYLTERILQFKQAFREG